MGGKKYIFSSREKLAWKGGVFEWKIEGNFIKKKNNKKTSHFPQMGYIKGLDDVLFIFESWEITMKKILKDKYFLLLKKKNIYINSTQFDTWKLNVSPE